MPIILDDIARRVLTPAQQKLVPLLQDFSETHFLAGGTAIALQIGHRESIDFDFFSLGNQGSFADFFHRVQALGFDISEEDRERYQGAEFLMQDEIHASIEGVRVSIMDFSRTLYNYQKIQLEGKGIILSGLRVASLQELACMKVYAMITRSKWKDAVDLYFLLHHLGISLDSILGIAENEHYLKIFNRSAVLEQLISMDWDMTEGVTYLIEHPSDTQIAEWLRDEALKIFK